MEHNFAEEREKERSDTMRESCNFMFDKILDTQLLTCNTNVEFNGLQAAMRIYRDF